MRTVAAFITLILFFTVLPRHSHAAAEGFEAWLQNFRVTALHNGISADVVNAALTGIEPIDRVIELDRKQPEGTMTFARYYERVINATRINKGREMMHRYASELADIEHTYGVAPQYVVALWGIETSYGANTGGFHIIPALATLAWEGRRSAFFTDELLAALRILDQGHISVDDMKGSWAGAMGQNQFMPSSFHNFAVDGNNDGRKDIWNTPRDVFASTANYLSQSGWKGDERWGRRVELPGGFSEKLVGLDTRKDLASWQALGVRLPGGGNLPRVSGMSASLVAPDGLNGPVFLVYDNYRTIMRWNKSTYFATSVGLLADAITTR